MSDKKASSSSASWALLVEGVSSARVEAYRMRHLLNRALQIVDSSIARDHLYQVAGDIIAGFPERLQRLELVLDRTSLALSKMGETHLKERLPLSERELVEESLERSSAFPSPMKRMTSRVALKYLRKQDERE